ncbi:peroxide stress protein YaaA [Candidatus Allofournierella excrementigallinarum]|uniref:peroxide stress protein YaaA n=1 Tax=Candidatus Allofournierella excrementigallinarum TaxID=2838592 RepID=UPI00374E3799
MKIIISPAKKMKADDGLPWRDLPAFLEKTGRLLAALRAMPYDRLKSLWKCNDSIAEENLRRLERMDLRRNLTPAILSYEGIQYRYMAPDVFTDREFDYLQEHLRILSGFYGLLRPFDGVRPYRLEMQAKLSVDGVKDLYAFWGADLAAALADGADWVLDLASKEYSAAVEKHLPSSVPLVRCVFGEEQEGKVVEKGTFCKMARGEMVRFMTETGAARPEDLQGFDRLGYRFSPCRSGENTLVFLRGE